jgi:hypothetical protein
VNKSTKTLARWILGFVLLDAVLLTIPSLMGEAALDAKLIVILVLSLVNFPGFILAARLDLLGNGMIESPHNPVLAAVVVYGFSLIFYGGCIWVIQRGITGRRSESDKRGSGEK